MRVSQSFNLAVGAVRMPVFTSLMACSASEARWSPPAPRSVPLRPKRARPAGAAACPAAPAAHRHTAPGSRRPCHRLPAAAAPPAARRGRCLAAAAAARSADRPGRRTPV
ncbi:hypothetical protein G6F59_016931 [Rhizopus arrhizus]|nr:hypothetical protein G6F59_016931 [Rhizopus arrhizus]